MIHPEAQIRTEKPDLVNDNELIIEYNKKNIVSMKLSIDIKNPKNRGKVVVAGLDISPNSHVFLEFEYQKDNQGIFIMNKVFKNAQLVVDFNNLENKIAATGEIPFTLKDRIEPKWGLYEVPFLRSNLKLDNFYVKEKYDNIRI